jgi:hypothetical protein
MINKDVWHDAADGNGGTLSFAGMRGANSRPKRMESVEIRSLAFNAGLLT